ncbi:MAG: YihY family inner membrane protein [Chloroflexota bacterium]|nr:YihY family inner membrane protein [Chloroflexota bacterium]MDP9473273.1 YihY family inner membrane protein [Chloroflexota bacterium]
MTIGEVEIASTAKATFKDFREDDLQGMAAEVAYHLLFSVVPLLIFLTALSGFVSRMIGVQDAMSSVTDWLFANLPRQAAEAVEEPIRGVIANQSGSVLSFGALAALWGGKNAMSSLMKGLNIAFDVTDPRPWWRRTLVALALTVALGLGVIGASTFFLLGSVVGEALANLLGLGDAWTTVWGIVRWLLIVLLLIVALAFLYWAGPNVDAPFKWLTPGSVLAVLLWVIATFALSIYFRYFAGYTETYGVLGGVLAFVFWLYVMSLILLLGGELNAVLTQRYDPQTQADIASDPAKQGSKRRVQRSRAAGATETAPQSRSPEAAAPGIAGVAPNPAIGSSVPWPSAERLAQQALAAEGSAERQRRSRDAVTALAVSAAAALLAIGRRISRR